MGASTRREPGHGQCEEHPGLSVGVAATVKEKLDIVEIVGETRKEPRLALGGSPRAGISLYRMAQGYAAVHGRDAVLPDDVKAVAPKTLVRELDAR